MAGPLGIGTRVALSDGRLGWIVADDNSANYTVVLTSGIALTGVPPGPTSPPIGVVALPAAVQLVPYASAVANAWGGAATSLAGTATVSGGQVTAVTLTSIPAGFTGGGSVYGPLVRFLGGGGSGAAGYVTGTTVVITSGGSGYTSVPIVLFGTPFGQGLL